ncbi:MAG: hypothetical protein ACE5LC_07875 [Candidatus Aminicenantales bacterium]
MIFAVDSSGGEKMQTSQQMDLQSQINEAYKKLKCKKVLYFYDESGTKQRLGVFSKKKAEEIKKYLHRKNLLNRISEFEVLTTEPDTDFHFT